MASYFLRPHRARRLRGSLDPQDYAQAIADLWYSPEKMIEMGRNGRRAFEERFNWDAEGEKLLALYARLTGREP